MLQAIQKLRLPLAFFFSALTMQMLVACYPFPRLEQNVLLNWVYYQSRPAYWSFKIGWGVVLFGVPFLYFFYPILGSQIPDRLQQPWRRVRRQGR